MSFRPCSGWVPGGLAVAEQPEMFVATVCDELLATIPYAWTAVALTNDPACLRDLAGRFIFRGSAPVPAERLEQLASDLLETEFLAGIYTQMANDMYMEAMSKPSGV